MSSRAAPAGTDLPRRVFVAVAVVSAAVLMLQIVLNRIFSFTIWYHFAYISVSLALLGFAASGAMLAAFPRLGGGSVEESLGRCCLWSALSTVVVLLVVGSVRLNPFAAVRSPLELGTLAVYFLAVSVPFFFAGLAITIALRAAGPAVNRLYFADLVGAGLGCAAVVYAIDAFGGPRAVLVTAALLALAGVVVSGRGAPRLRTANLVAGALVLAVTGPLPGWLAFPPSPDKNIARWLRTGKPYFSRWGALFRTDLMGARESESTFGGYRVQGVSPRFRGNVPAYRMIFHDGGASAIMYQSTRDVDGFEMFRHHVLTAPYVVRAAPDVLVIGVGGGADVVNALANGARSVTGAELNPVTVDLVTEHFRDFTGGVYDRPDVAIRKSEGRHFVGSTDQRFDLIQLTGVDTLAALSSGAYVLSENYLYTVEAYAAYFGALRADGVLSIGALDFHPDEGYPRHALRFAALSREALARRGAARPHEHVMLVAEKRSPRRKGVAEFELLTKKEPFSAAEVAAIERFVDANDFEAWYLPGRPDRQRPLFRTVLEGDGPAREAFLADTFLDLRPTTDDRPFFFSFYKWRHLFEHRREIDVGHTLATGQVVLALILVLAVAFSAATIALPMLRVRAAARAMPGRVGFLAYFAALGAGFIFAEISFVQKFILFLGYPTYSLSVMLFTFLTAAGIGAWLSGRLPADPARVLPALAAALTALVLFYVVALGGIFEAVLAASLPLRMATTVALAAPLGGVLGTFFPYAVRLLSAVNRDFVAWAWAVNGCFTVVGSVLSIIVAMTWGFTAVIVLALAVYWVGVASFVRTHRRVGPASAVGPA
jgi:hypothetical protein